MKNKQIKFAAIVLLTANFLFQSTELFCQSVGVNGTGGTPNVSALLDIDATGMSPKGLLIPRIALTSVTDAATIATPATSLLVYNNGAGALIPAGYYYNQGTSGSPNWVPFLTNNVNTPAAWSLKGNTGTTGGPNFIGTTDNISLRFRTNNTEKMIIDSLGNVGIGKTSTGNALHVYRAAGGDIIRAESSTTATLARIFSRSKDQSGVTLDMVLDAWGGSSYGSVGTATNHPLVFLTNLLERMRIDISGNVSIGGVSPSAKFHVASTTASVGAYQQILEGATSGYGAGVSFQSNLTSGGLKEMARITADGENAWNTTGSTQDAGLRFYTAQDGTTTERVRINTLGAVSFYNYGAGTLTTDASGNITAASDERLKNIEGSFTRGLSEIRKITPILYKWKASSKLDTTTTYAGFSAQNIKSVIPEAIGVSPDGYYTFQDRPVEAALVNAVKELDAQIKMLQKTINTLESENKNLQISSEMRISKLEKMIQATNKEEAKK